MNTTKVALVASSFMGKIKSIIGYTVGAFSLLCMIFALSDINGEGAIEALVFFTVVFIGCIFLVLSGFKTKKRIIRFKKYVLMISNENLTSLQNIASATNQSVDFVKNDLQIMINKKFFANAHIDSKMGEIIIGDQNKTNLVAQALENRNIETLTLKCNGCGAINSKHVNESNTCDYCGTLLS